MDGSMRKIHEISRIKGGRDGYNECIGEYGGIVCADGTIDVD